MLLLYIPIYKINHESFLYISVKIHSMKHTGLIIGTAGGLIIGGLLWLMFNLFKRVTFEVYLIIVLLIILFAFLGWLTEFLIKKTKVI